MKRHTFSKAQIGDITINYELVDYTAPWRTTEPETFLLYHGYARNMLFWEQWIPLLATDYRVLRFDARGCGESSAPPAGALMTFDQLVGDSLGMMDKLGIKRAHWVGESSGGIVGLAFALAHPDRLHTLNLCDTPFKRSPKIETTYTVGEPTRAAAFAKHGVGGWCRQTLPYRIDMTRASPELCEWYIREMDRTPVDVAVQKSDMVGRGDFWPHLPQVTVPTLMLAGQKSQLAEEENMLAMQKQMPRAKLVTFEGYGHGINLLAAERCVSEIRQFIAAQRRI